MSMLPATSQLTPLDLIEEFREVDTAQTAQGCLFTEMWRNRPADGLQLGRDIPSRTTAQFLSHLMVVELIEGGKDWEFVLVGETLRARFSSSDPVGKKLSQLVAPDVFAFHHAKNKQLLTTDEMTILAVQLVKRCADSHFEHIPFRYDLIILPIWSKDRSHKLILSAWFNY